MLERLLLVAVVVASLPNPARAQTEPTVESTPIAERVTFDEAVKRATESNPTVGQAAQAILRAEALLEQARSVFLPNVYGNIGTTVLDAARGFDGGAGFEVTQPRTQSAFSATATYSVFAPVRWAQENQAADQVGIARISAEETRRQVGLMAAQAYLAVIAAQRQREIAMRNRDTAKALADYAGARLDAGQGSRLNHVRSLQELAAAKAIIQADEFAVRQAQEALGVALFVDGPVDANGDPVLEVAPPSTDNWLTQRPDVRLSAAQVAAADRVARDSWKSWLPEGTASFTPQYVTPAGLFEPQKTWRALFTLDIPIFDGSLGGAKRARIAERETAKLRLDSVKIQARSEVRSAENAVMRIEQIVLLSREASQNASEALQITQVAYKAGATTNIEVVQAQQTARNTEIITAQAEDRLRQARLDLLVALGRFPQ